MGLRPFRCSKTGPHTMLTAKLGKQMLLSIVCLPMPFCCRPSFFFSLQSFWCFAFKLSTAFPDFCPCSLPSSTVRLSRVLCPFIFFQIFLRPYLDIFHFRLLFIFLIDCRPRHSYLSFLKLVHSHPLEYTRRRFQCKHICMLYLGSSLRV